MMTLIKIAGVLFYPFIILVAIGFVAYLVVKTVGEERAQRQAELMQQATEQEGIWPPPPNKPAV